MSMHSNFYKILAYHMFTGTSTVTTYPIAYLMNIVDTVDDTDPGIAFCRKDNSGSIIAVGSKNGDIFTASAHVTSEVGDTGVTVTGVYTITNNGENDITIEYVKLKEYGVMAGADSTNSGYVYCGMTELDTPLVIAANGGIGKVTYTATFTYPT